jgi:hypothetical protein
MTIRAHFDGNVIVPDEPVDLPVNESFELELIRRTGVSPEVATAMAAARDPAEIARRLKALEEFVALGANDTDIPLEMLRREHLYDDRGR